VVNWGSKLKKGNGIIFWSRAEWLRPSLCRDCLVVIPKRFCGKWKKGKGFLKLNFEPGPNWAGCRRALTAIYYYRRPVVSSRLWKEGVLMLPILIYRSRDLES
jgi:hypothetical protein